MFRAARFLFALTALLGAAGCAERLALTHAEFSGMSVPSSYHIHGIPPIEQEAFFCGPAALSALLHFHDQPQTQHELAEQVFNEAKQGTFQHDMLFALRSRGLIAAPVNNLRDLVVEISQDNPVLVFQNLALSWSPKWHYAVATGYDLDKQLLYLNGGRNQQEVMRFATFGHTWRRTGYWGYVVTRPPRLPYTSDIHTLDDLALRFEALNLPMVAVKTYQALIDRTPTRSHPYFGLGNIYLAQAKYGKAEQAYQSGLEVEPKNHLIRNNLAYALAYQQQTSKACEFLNDSLGLHETGEEAWEILEDSHRELCDGQ